MRHRKTGRRLGRNSAHRKAMYRNMVTSLMVHGQIQTTEAKAKELGLATLLHGAYLPVFSKSGPGSGAPLDSTATYAPTTGFGDGSIIMVAVDLDNNAIWFGNTL